MSRRINLIGGLLTMVIHFNADAAAVDAERAAYEADVQALLARMTLEEKIGQMQQVNGASGRIPESLREAIAAGRVGSVINEVDVATVNDLQRIAVKESRLGIPLLIGRDVIHGFKTVLPIPLGQAATFNPELVEKGARVAAREAAAAGVNWTFAPMIDISRDPRWGRIAESFGEDPYLTGVLGAAAVRGFQGDDLAQAGSIAACVKHFAGYGASEAGRDYATTNIPENELRNVYLRPFHDAVKASVATLMTSFSDLNGVPATANAFLLEQVLREEWGFDGLVVSDWASIEQLSVHGFTADDRQSAFEAVRAGVNMEMASTAYADHLRGLVAEGRIEAQRIDQLVGDILRTKFRLGLFEDPYTDPAAFPAAGHPDHLQLAREMALQSLVLLENRDGALPLEPGKLRSLAVIGPLADDPYEQLGTWIFDGDMTLSQTPLAAIRRMLGDDVEVTHVRALETSRSRSTEGFAEAIEAARSADATLLFLGEESILSGETHSRADIGLPGSQEQLVAALEGAGGPVIAVVMAGRPLTLGRVPEQVDALLFAWHPGSMGGPAIADVLFGVESPSGKLPATFPRVVGQVPIYYNQKHTGRPGTAENYTHMDDISVRAPQYSWGFGSFHLDAGFEPRYAFGHGLSYASFVYSGFEVDPPETAVGGKVRLRAEVRNEGRVVADEVVQLYIRDLVGDVTRPVRELKGFRRLRLDPGEAQTVEFVLGPDELAFYGRDMRLMVEPGEFQAWIGGSSQATLGTVFRLAPVNSGADR